jgi:ATP:corrinoid adenosyltransferase
MIHQVHFYYGDRLRTFHVGLGIVVRALGHSINSEILFLDESYEWVKDIISLEDVPVRILSIEDQAKIQNFFLEEIKEIKDTILLIANIDLIVHHQVLEIKELLHLLTRIKEKNEVILTSETKYTEFEYIADYVSFISVRKM